MYTRSTRFSFPPQAPHFPNRATNAAIAARQVNELLRLIRAQAAE